MPVSHKVIVEAGILRVRRWGQPSTQDEALACKQRKEDPLVVVGIPVLVDCTEVEPSDTVETVKYLADCTTKLAADLQCGPLAIIVASDVEYGMARMYMAHTELAHPMTQVFRSEKEAIEWLTEQPKSNNK